MPRNGSGSYSLPAGNPFVPSTVISSTTMNNTMSDIGTALTQSLSNDGQTTPVADLPMATFKHTNVGNANARNQYAAAGQVQDSSLLWLTSIAGADTITASIAPSPTAYVAGQVFRFVAASTNTTSTVTLNINSLGAKNVTKRGNAPVVSGDLVAGRVYEVVYDGTQFQVQSIEASVSPVVGSARNVRMSVTAASSSATLTANEVVVETAIAAAGSNGTTYRLSSFSGSINLATTGAGGMDTGSAPLNSFVAIYVIYNPSTNTSALLGKAAGAAQAEVYIGANMPAGYTASALISVVPTNGTGQIVSLTQDDRKIGIGGVTVLSSNTIQTSFTSVSLSSAVPPNARYVGGYMGIGSVQAGANINLIISSVNTGAGLGNNIVAISACPANMTSYGSFSDLIIPTTQTLYYQATTTGVNLTGVQITISSYRF